MRATASTLRNAPIIRIRYVLIVISPSPDCKILSIPCVNRAQNRASSVTRPALASAASSSQTSPRAVIIAPLVLKMSATCARRSSRLQYLPFAHQSLARVIYCLAPTRVNTTQTTRQSSAICHLPSSSSTRDRRRARARLRALARRARAHLDDDERSPELIER